MGCSLPCQRGLAQPRTQAEGTKESQVHHGQSEADPGRNIQQFVTVIIITLHANLKPVDAPS